MHPTDIPHSSAADTSVLNSPSTAVHRPPSSSSLSSAFGNLGPPGLGQRHPSAGSTSNQLARGADSSSPNTGGVTNLSNQPQLIQPGPPSVPHPIFEFTKRKRWADLLVTQLSEAILLVLSPQMNVLYCGSAVWALLGWQDHEWVDKCLLDFMNLDDRNTFQRLFTESMVNKTELTSYTRLQYKPSPSTSNSSLALANATASYPHSNAGHAPLSAPYHPYAQQAHVPYHQQASGPPQGQGPGPHGHHFGAPTSSPRPAGYHPQQGYTQTPQQRRQRDQGSTEGRKEVLFEIVGAPYFLPLEDTFKCFYAVAKPYPSRNTAILNTFLELKLENERLHDRLAQLKLSKPKHPLPSASSSSNNIPTIVPSNSTSTSPVTRSAGGQPHSISQPGSTSSSIAIPAATSFFGGTYNELMALPGQGQVVQGVSAPRYRFENLFHEDGELTMDTTTARPGGLDGLGISGSGLGGQGVSVGIDGLAGQGAGTVTGVGPGPGPVGGTVVMGEEDESAKKKARKVYLPEQYVCMTCGRTDSPEWRKGPSGPKTLCNACGLRWAKREKEKRAALRASGQSGTGLN